VEQQVNFKYRDIPEKLYCEYCGTEIYDFEDPTKSPYKECPHVVFIYMWADPDAFVYTRKDYAGKIIEALLRSDYYKSMIDDEDCVPLSLEEISKFRDSRYEPLDNISTKVAQLSGLPEEEYPELLPSDTIVYKGDRNYSGVRIAITSK
jgi:hypothetical protein